MSTSPPYVRRGPAWSAVFRALQGTLPQLEHLTDRVLQVAGPVVAASTRAQVAEEIALHLIKDADDESHRPNRNCCSRTIEAWLREAAEVARQHATDDEQAVGA